MQLNLKQKTTGIGLLELMLSLAVIGILIVMVTTYFKPASQAKNVNNAINMLEAIQSAGQRWLLTHDDYSLDKKDKSNGIIAAFVDRNFLPHSFLTAKNPWDGYIDVTTSTDHKTGAPVLSVEMNNVPAKACNALKEQAVSLTCGSDEPYITACVKKTPNIFTILLPSRCPTS